MNNWNKLNKEILPLVEEKLGKIHGMPEDERYEAITEMLASISLSPDEKLKLRKRLKIEYGYPPADFDQAFACRFNHLLWERVGRPN